METNQLAEAMQQLIGQPIYQSSFNMGIYFGFGVIAFCLGISMLRVLGGHDKEDL